jgi:hypothetical protein
VDAVYATFFPPRIKAGVFDLSHPKNEPSDEAKDLIRPLGRRKSVVQI